MLRLCWMGTGSRQVYQSLPWPASLVLRRPTTRFNQFLVEFVLAPVGILWCCKMPF